MDVCCETLFLREILFMHVDNVGSVFSSENTSASQWTKYLDVHHHFICDYVEDGTVEIIFSSRGKDDRFIYKEPR